MQQWTVVDGARVLYVAFLDTTVVTCVELPWDNVVVEEAECVNLSP